MVSYIIVGYNYMISQGLPVKHLISLMSQKRLKMFRYNIIILKCLGVVNSHLK